MSAAAQALSFRPLGRADLALLHEWVQRPHVARWWDAPRTLAEIEAAYLPVVEGRDTTRAWIVEREGEAVAFAQCYVVTDAGEGWWPQETDPGARGIDQFIADERHLGQGLGTALVRALVAMLFADPRVTLVQADPAPSNLRAIRCYEKAGLRRERIVATPDGEALLMRLRRPALR